MITLRRKKGQKLTIQELDSNLTHLERVSGGGTSPTQSSVGVGSTIEYNLDNSSCWYHTNLTGNFTASIVTQQDTRGQLIKNFTVYIDQNQNTYRPSKIIINDGPVDVLWKGGTYSLTPNSLNKLDFTLIFRNNGWNILIKSN